MLGCCHRVHTSPSTARHTRVAFAYSPPFGNRCALCLPRSLASALSVFLVHLPLCLHLQLHGGESQLLKENHKTSENFLQPNFINE